MKRIITITIPLLIMFLAVGIIEAQSGGFPPHGAEGKGSERFEKIREKVEMIKMWRLTEELDLTEAQSTKLFAVMNESNDLRDSIHTQQRKLIDTIKELEETNSFDDEKELARMIEKHTELQTTILESHLKLIEDVKDILSLEQQVKLILFQHEFRDEIRDLIRTAQQKREFEPQDRGFEGGPRR